MRLLSNLKWVILSLVISMVADATAVRLKDIANVRGVRSNQLIGYGIVIGLNGTGDSQLEFTNKSMKRVLDKLGVKLEGEEVSSQNVAAVMITASLPPFARAGNQIDVTVHSIGDASSLRGGTLVQTPLRAANQQIYAVAQGGILVGGAEGGIATSGRVPNGGMIERDLADDFSGRKMFRISLHEADFTTAARVAKTLNKRLGGQYAEAKDAGTIDIIAPFSYEGKGVELLALIEATQVVPDSIAKVIINQKTGTVIIGENVKISKVAISHGDLSIKVTNPNAPAQGRRGPASKADEQRVVMMPETVNVGDLVQVMNKLGVKPQELITVLETIKAAGALHGELEVL